MPLAVIHKPTFSSKVKICWCSDIARGTRVVKGEMLGFYITDTIDMDNMKITAPETGTILSLLPSFKESDKSTVAIIDTNTRAPGIKVRREKDACESLNSASHLLLSGSSSSTRTSIKSKPLLILDLDNTIIHSKTLSTKGSIRNISPTILSDSDIHFFGVEDTIYILKKRPFLTSFLHDLNESYTIAVCTMGTRPYAKSILDIIDPTRIYITDDRLISREMLGESNRKSISLFREYGENIIVVDDNSRVWTEKEYVIQVLPFQYFRKGELITSSKQTHDILLPALKAQLIAITQVADKLSVSRLNVQLYKIYRAIVMQAFRTENVSFVGSLTADKIFEESLEYKTLKVMGAETISMTPGASTTLAFEFNKFDKGDDDNNNNNNNNIHYAGLRPISPWYIHVCRVFGIRLKMHYFYTDNIPQVEYQSITNLQEALVYFMKQLYYERSVHDDSALQSIIKNVEKEISRAISKNTMH
jgi:FCP1-like phosphatase family protein